MLGDTQQVLQQTVVGITMLGMITSHKETLPCVRMAGTQSPPLPWKAGILSCPGHHVLGALYLTATATRY